MPNFNKFNQFTQYLCNGGGMNLGTDQLRIFLTNNVSTGGPALTSQFYNQESANEIATAGGYNQGGALLTNVSGSGVTGLYSLVSNNLTFASNGGTFGQLRYAVLYDAQPGTRQYLIGWWDNGSSVSIGPGNSFTVQLGNGVLTLQ